MYVCIYIYIYIYIYTYTHIYIYIYIKAPNQGLQSSFCCCVAGQRLSQKERFCSQTPALSPLRPVFNIYCRRKFPRSICIDIVNLQVLYIVAGLPCTHTHTHTPTPSGGIHSPTLVSKVPQLIYDIYYDILCTSL